MSTTGPLRKPAMGHGLPFPNGSVTAGCTQIAADWCITRFRQPLSRRRTLARDARRMLRVAAYEVLNVPQSFWRRGSARSEILLTKEPDLLRLLGVDLLRRFERAAHLMKASAAVRTSGARIRPDLP
jgi:hypothetical protein